MLYLLRLVKLLGYPSSGSSAEGLTWTAPRQNRWGAYVQDEWRATRKLTVNMGLRWDFFQTDPAPLPLFCGLHSESAILHFVFNQPTPRFRGVIAVAATADKDLHARLQHQVRRQLGGNSVARSKRP